MTARKKKPASTSCGLTGAQAQDAYEQALAADAQAAPPTQNLADHIAGCTPCSAALNALELQGDAVGQLAKGTGGAGTAVEGILRVAARSGTGKLADLAYELAKACLIQLPNLKRRVRLVVEPREAPVVASELRTANQRRGLASKPVDLKGVPAAAPPEAEALKAAASCLRIVEQVEGASPRQVLCMSQVHIFQEHPERAEAELRALLARPISQQMRLYGYQNLMLALNRQGKHKEAIAVGSEALHSHSNDWQVLINFAVAHAHLRQARQFKVVAKRLGMMANQSDSTYLSTLVKFEIPRFADDLGSPLIEVEQAFGLHRSSRSL